MPNPRAVNTSNKSARAAESHSGRGRQRNAIEPSQLQIDMRQYPQ